ncbi:MAG TPA: hypothetical protein VN862_00270 [Candidatus Acidoferrales bacterium]|nr:hypothetical protein [Candidatus Acidoferrales bacterium]
MTKRKSFLWGAVLGDFLALIVGIVLLLPFPFSHSLHVHLVTAGFWLCPFYVLMFMSLVHSTGAVVAISLVGNAILYGVIGALVRTVYKKSRRLLAREQIRAVVF